MIVYQGLCCLCFSLSVECIIVLLFFVAYEKCAAQAGSPQQAIQMLSSAKLMLRGVEAKIKVSLRSRGNYESRMK